jgi:hypothetical protein
MSENEKMFLVPHKAKGRRHRKYGWQPDHDGEIDTYPLPQGCGIVSLADAIVALQVMADLQPQSLRTDYRLSNADVNRDGRAGMAEVIYILQKVAEARP